MSLHGDLRAARAVVAIVHNEVSELRSERRHTRNDLRVL